jgi:hypothetical protein
VPGHPARLGRTKTQEERARFLEENSRDTCLHSIFELHYLSLCNVCNVCNMVLQQFSDLPSCVRSY